MPLLLLNVIIKSKFGNHFRYLVITLYLHWISFAEISHVLMQVLHSYQLLFFNFFFSVIFHSFDL